MPSMDKTPCVALTGGVTPLIGASTALVTENVPVMLAVTVTIRVTVSPGSSAVTNDTRASGGMTQPSSKASDCEVNSVTCTAGSRVC
jgi:hypothetical protein